MGYIYALENLANKKMYIGQTINLHNRILEHFSDSSKCPAIAAAINKYRKENFYFTIIERCSSLDELNEREIYWIKEINTISPNGYNLKEGGAQGGSPSKETRYKIRNSLLGFKHSDKTKDKLSKERKERFSNKENCPNYGRVFSEEHRRKISISNSGEQHWAYGNKMRSESVVLMRKNRKGKGTGPRREETKRNITLAHQRKSILTWDVIYQIRHRYAEGGTSQRILAKEYNISQAQIGNIVRGKCWRNIP